MRYSSAQKLIVSTIAALAIGLSPSAAEVRADGAPDAEAHKLEAPRPAYGGGGVGGFFALTGPIDSGPAAELEYYPGGRFGRLGLRAMFLSMGPGASIGTLGVGFEAATARPRLALALHAEIGVASAPNRPTKELDLTGTHPLLGSGVQVTLWAWQYLAVGVDGMAFLILDGLDTSLVFTQVLTVRIAR